MERSLRPLRIHTARLCVRTFTPLDLDVLHTLAQQPEITDALPDWAISRERCRNWLDARCITDNARLDPAALALPLAICLHDGELIGWLDVRPDPETPPDTAAVSYALARQHRGRGYASEALRATSRWLFAHSGWVALIAMVRHDQISSQQALHACGFQPHGQVIRNDQVFGRCMLLRAPQQLALIPAGEHDAEAISALMVRAAHVETHCWLGEHAPFIPDHDQPAMQRYHSRNGQYFRIELDGELAGVILVSHSGHEHARIEFFYLEPAFQSLGLGSKVLALVETRFAQVTLWTLDTTRHSTRNLPFYQRNGYEIAGMDDDEYYLVKHLPQRNDVADDLRRARRHRGSEMAEHDFYEVDMARSSFSNSNLAGVRAQNSDLRGLFISNCNASELEIGNARFDNSVLRHVSIGGVRFEHCNQGWFGERRPLYFAHSDLAGSELVGCDLTNVRLAQCQTEGLTIDGIPLSELLAAYAAQQH
ncbi:GNAT family N-acetyltransferase [Chitinolyticbacter albus]|uniref:GNAT family N-acetyltransferase n=1 Tax=Chitinolyticbacter albus TaxID=2961951 RepID=UPI0021090CA1|nr:GNAT family N-acetyltransferase [Chitinolyticbacter albus]